MSKSKRANIEEEQEGIPEWMLTYSDMVTLLLTFFIMLFSMASVDQQKFDQVASSFKQSFFNLGGGDLLTREKGSELISITESNVNTENMTEEQIKKAMEEQLDEVGKEIAEAVESYGLTEFIGMVEDEEKLIIRFDSLILFDSGSADVKESGKESLLKIGQLLSELENDIEIHGHTDNLPINTYLYPSNWELSTRRATNVGKFLIDKCELDPARLTATGSGEYKPIADNATSEGRQKNRRMDIVIKK